MRAGNAYHRVTFYQKTTVRDAYGSSVDTYTNLLDTRGEIRYTGGNKQLSADEIFYSRNMELIIRWRSDMDETMRVTLDGDTDTYYEILYIEELGRHDSLKFTLNKINE